VSVRAYTAARGIDFRQLSKEDRSREVAALGRHLMTEVGRLIPVLPVPLVATALLRAAPRALSELELKSEVAGLVRELETAGARIYLPRGDWDYAVGAGLRALVLRHAVQERGGLFCPEAGEEALLSYYANSIAHLRSADLATPDEVILKASGAAES
jgi:glycerol-3-phosphate O-acyltransferase